MKAIFKLNNKSIENEKIDNILKKYEEGMNLFAKYFADSWT